MQRSTPNPIQYLLGVALPTPAHDAVAYFVVCQADGKSIMGKNYLHGIVNTHGCWMLFRNFNWPPNKADAFELIYRKDRVNQVPDLRAALAAQGYDDAGQAGVRAAAKSNGSSTTATSRTSGSAGTSSASIISAPRPGSSGTASPSILSPRVSCVR